jgi:hypothetical protein
VAAVLRVPPGWEPPGGGLSLALDGEDVTARCALRVGLTEPVRRVELVLPDASGLEPGRHEAVVRWAGADGAPRTHAWTFEAG